MSLKKSAYLFKITFNYNVLLNKMFLSVIVTEGDEAVLSVEVMRY